MEDVIKTCLYSKRGVPFETTFAYFKEEWDKDAALIMAGNHPYIGYVDRSKKGWKITDAWWMK